MPKLSEASKRKLNTCDPKLIQVVERAIEIVPPDMDFTVLKGHRGQEEQTLAFNQGHSKLPWPRSKHNKEPSFAVDIAPYPIDWQDLNRFNRLASYMFRASMELGIEIRWGGHWITFRDYPHWEING